MVPFHTETMATPAMAMTPLPLLSIRELNDEVLECRIVVRLAEVGRVWNQPRKNNPFLHAACTGQKFCEYCRLCFIALHARARGSVARRELRARPISLRTQPQCARHHVKASKHGPCCVDRCCKCLNGCCTTSSSKSPSPKSCENSNNATVLKPSATCVSGLGALVAYEITVRNEIRVLADTF
jgi:hypothetical protein